jgi:hypothetical protein
MDDKKLLPSRETIRRFSERAALYEQTPPKNTSRRHKKNQPNRDISEYNTDEPAPTNEDFTNILTQVWAGASKVDKVATLRQYLRTWARWLRLGLNDIPTFEQCVASSMPCLAACWVPVSPTGTVIGLYPVQVISRKKSFTL